MPGLSIIVASADGERFYAALETAAAAAALGRSARIFLQGQAAALLRTPVAFAGDAARRAAGQPDLVSLIAEAMAMDVRLTVCQSGMALIGMTASELVPQVRTGGLVSFTAEIGDADRLVVF
ncbi:DsrE family protein [Sphingopyxis sp.]|jgi:predicted peroxiredoxin|uniref:DsrE family protein n=1 Tax=Sphingopyxis sp. TaxID=1908224 RepID=UPI0025CD98D7|nr:DsrE family protein [Sphingopyxis sp.]MBK6412600.1 DsrE family protein [Sphingopyxis sp.]